MAHLSNPRGVNPGISGRSSSVAWTRWCSASTFRSSRETEDVGSSKISIRHVRYVRHTQGLKILTLPWIRVRRHCRVLVELLHFVQRDNEAVLWRIVLDLVGQPFFFQNLPLKLIKMHTK